MSTPITTAIGRVQPLYCGEYDSSKNYEKLDNVLYDGCTYVALKNVPAGQVPGSASSSYWQLIAEKGNTGGFGIPTASASALAAGQTPTVTITPSGPDTAKIFDFKFGIPAGPTGPIGFNTISAGASALPVGARPTVNATRTETSGNINLDFQFGIPAAEGQGAISVDNIGLDQNRNINLTAVRAIQNQTFTETQKGYVRDNIGAVPTSRTINGKNLASNITLVASDVGAVPTDRTVNSKNLNSNITLTAADVGAVPTERTINNKNLNSNITLAAADVSAVPTSRKVNGKNLNSDITLTAADVGAVPTSRTVNNKALSSNITLTAANINTSGGQTVQATLTDLSENKQTRITAKGILKGNGTTVSAAVAGTDYLTPATNYSPLKDVKNANYSIDASDAGKTLVPAYSPLLNVAVTFTLPQSVSASFPVGTEIAFFWQHSSSLKLVFSGGARCAKAGDRVFTQNISYNFPDMYSMVAIKKTGSVPGGDYWILQGNVEVVS